MDTLRLAQDDYGYYVDFTVYQNDGTTPFDLSGYTVKIKVWEPGVPGTLLFTAATLSVTDATNGVCRYTVAQAHMGTAGDYYAELECTKSGVVESTETYRLVVEESG